MSDIVPAYLSETQKHSGYKLLNNKLIKFDKKKKKNYQAAKNS